MILVEKTEAHIVIARVLGGFSLGFFLGLLGGGGTTSSGGSSTSGGASWDGGELFFALGDDFVDVLAGELRDHDVELLVVSIDTNARGC